MQNQRLKIMVRIKWTSKKMTKTLYEVICYKHIVECYPFEEIAKYLKISVEQVKKIYYND